MNIFDYVSPEVAFRFVLVAAMALALLVFLLRIEKEEEPEPDAHDGRTPGRHQYDRDGYIVRD